MAADFVLDRGLPPADKDDLVQEILLHWLTHRHAYRQDRGTKQQTFFRRLAKNRLEDWFRERTAAKRGGRTSSLSLDESIDPNERESGPSRGDLLPDSGDIASEVESKLERERILELLTPEQRRLVLALEQGYSIADVARRTGAARTTLNDELARIKRVLRQQGLSPDGY